MLKEINLFLINKMAPIIFKYFSHKNKLKYYFEFDLNIFLNNLCYK